MIDATFIMEQHLGHRSYYENLRRGIDAVQTIKAEWVEVTYQSAGRGWEQCATVLPDHIRGTLTGRRQVRKGLRQRRPRVAVFNTQVPAALAGRLLQRQPYIICTDVTPRQYDQMAAEYAHTVDGQGPLARYKHWVNTKVLNGAARLLPWSTWAGVSLSTDYGVDRRRIEVVHPGVDLARWSPRSRTPAANPVRILFVGGHFERKGGDLLLQAFRALPAKAAELVVVSRTLLPKEEGVHVHCNLTPNSSELIQLFQSCDLFVLPTRAEAFGIAAVEAAATGLPIIATRVGGLSDIVQHGETGFLINGNDYDALQVHLLQLVQDPALRRQMGEKARAHALTHFDAQKNAARISQIIQEAASL